MMKGTNPNGTQVTDLSISTIPRAENWRVYVRMLSTVARPFLRPSDTREYDALDIAPETNVYYTPKPNEAAVDTFICYGGYLYLFQFTVSEKYKIRMALSRALQHVATFRHTKGSLSLSFPIVSRHSNARTQKVLSYKNSVHVLHK